MRKIIFTVLLLWAATAKAQTGRFVIDTLIRVKVDPHFFANAAYLHIEQKTRSQDLPFLEYNTKTGDCWLTCLSGEYRILVGTIKTHLR